MRFIINNNESHYQYKRCVNTKITSVTRLSEIIHSHTIDNNYTYHFQQCQVKIEEIG